MMLKLHTSYLLWLFFHRNFHLFTLVLIFPTGHFSPILGLDIFATASYNLKLLIREKEREKAYFIMYVCVKNCICRHLQQDVGAKHILRNQKQSLQPFRHSKGLTNNPSKQFLVKENK